MSNLFLLEVREDNNWVEHSHNVIESLQSCMLAEWEMGTRARDYILTGRPTALQKYQAGVVQLTQSLKNVQDLTIDNPEQQRRISTRLQPLLNERLVVISRAITARTTGG